MWTMTLALMAGFTACSDDDTIDRNYGVNNDEVYFPITLPKTIELSMDASSFEVELRRVRTSDAITVPIRVTDESGLFQIPANVSFPAGVDKATITIGYNYEALGFDTPRNVELRIDDENFITPYGACFYAFSAYVRAPWTQVGKGNYVYAQLWSGVSSGLPLYRSDLDPTQYMISGWGTTQSDFLFAMDEDGSVMVADQPTGYVHPTYGMVYVDDIVDYTGGTDYGFSSYADGVFTFVVVYYCEAGVFGNGPETFTLTSSAISPASRAAELDYDNLQMIQDILPVKAIRQ